MYAVPKALGQYNGVIFNGQVAYPDHVVNGGDKVDRAGGTVFSRRYSAILRPTGPTSHRP